MILIQIKTIRAVLILTIASAFFNLAFADASAIAFGSDNQWGWATRKTQREADDMALKGCNEASAKHDCKLRITKAIVRAEGGGQMGYGISSVSLADAVKKALETCGKPDCKVVDKEQTPGFFALAKSEPTANGDAIFHLVYRSSDSDNADAQAKQNCESRSAKPCSLLMSGAIPGIYSSEAPTRPVTDVAEQSCRPRTPTIRCTSRCTNGDCVVTYENSCQIRVQVRPNYNGMTNQWDYPSPSC